MIDCRAGGIFIDQNFAKNFELKKLNRPLTAKNVDGTINKKGTIKKYVDLEFEIDSKKFKERFYVTGLTQMTTMNTISSPTSLTSDMPGLGTTILIKISQPHPKSPHLSFHYLPPLAIRRTRRNVKPPGEWWKAREPTPAIESSSENDDDDDYDPSEEEEESAALAGTVYEPNTYKQAMRCPDAELWQMAAEEEMTSLISNGTWDIVPLPKDRKAIGCRWVFKVKKNALTS